MEVQVSDYHVGQRFQGLAVVPALLAGWCACYEGTWGRMIYRVNRETGIVEYWNANESRWVQSDSCFAGLPHEWELCADPSKAEEQPKPRPGCCFLAGQVFTLLPSGMKCKECGKVTRFPEGFRQEEPQLKSEPGVDWSGITWRTDSFLKSPSSVALSPFPKDTHGRISKEEWECLADSRLVLCANALKDIPDDAVKRGVYRMGTVFFQLLDASRTR